MTLPTRRTLRHRYAALLLAVYLLAAASGRALEPGTPLGLFVCDVWRDGLPQGTVHAIAQTRDGFVWAGTYEGLVRFNGVEFTVFDRGNTPELATNSIRSLLGASDGSLWIGLTEGGLARYRDGQFAAFGAAQGLPGPTVVDLTEDASGVVWAATTGGICRIEGDRLTAFTSRDGLPASGTEAVCSDGDGMLWVGTHKGLFRRAGETFVPVTGGTAEALGRIEAIERSAAGGVWIGSLDGRLAHARGDLLEIRDVAKDGVPVAITCALEDGAGSVWIGSATDGVYRFRGGAMSRLTRAEGLSHDTVRSLLEDREGGLWVGTNDGLCRLMDGKFSTYAARNGLASDNVRAVCQDPAGDVWVGTDGNGLSRIHGGTITTYTERDGLPDDFVRAVCPDRDGAIWVGTLAGVGRLAGGAFTSYADRQGLPEGIAHALWQAPDGAIWIGGSRGTASVYRAGAFERVDLGVMPPESSVRAFAAGSNGEVWVGTHGRGLGLVAANGTRFLTTRDGLANDTVFNVHQDADGYVWVATAAGLSLLRDGKFTTFTSREGLFSDTVFAILDDGAGSFWMSCNKGVFRVARRDLLEFDPASGRKIACAVFQKADGLGSNQCNGSTQPAAWRGADGRLWFATTGGASFVDPARLRMNTLAPPVVITRALADGAPLPADGGGISPFTERLEFAFDGLSFVAPERVRFRYKLEGYDSAWVEAGGRREAFYTNLPPGEYTFRVTASNNDGVWNEAGASRALRLPPPPWRTWWAYGLYALAAVGAVFGFTRLRLSALERRTRRLEAIVARRTAELRDSEGIATERATELALAVDQLKVSEREARDARERAVENERKAKDSERAALDASRAKSVFLSNMSHELRTPLNAVIGFCQLMTRDRALSGQQRDDLNVIMRSGEHLLELINDVLSIAKIEAGKLALAERDFDLLALFQSVREIISVRAEAKQLDVVFEIAPDMPQWVRGDDGKLRQVLINLLGNGVKFTERGRVMLRARWTDGALDGRLDLEVSDTGPGIAPHELGSLFHAFEQTDSGRRAREGNGLGLMISRAIVRMMRGDIGVTSRVGSGTVFRLHVLLPLAERPADAAAARRVARIAAGQPAPKILVVDDSGENRVLLGRLLRPVGFSVREAANGREAVDAWMASGADLILMDMRMPVMDGREATRRIRAHEAEHGAGRRAVPIVALTASAFEHEREAILADGCNEFIPKPFDESVVYEAIAAQLGLAYDYDDAEPSAAGEDEPGVGALSAERLRAVERGVAVELAGALHIGDKAAALAAVARVRDRDAELADDLARAIREYRFEELAALLERSRAGSGAEAAG